jgi:hypothetical protein
MNTLPTTAQMLSMRQGGQSASEMAMGIMKSALSTMPDKQGMTAVGHRQWRQSPYAELGLSGQLPGQLATQLPNTLPINLPVTRR